MDRASQDELIGVATLAMVEAADRYKPDLGFQFSTWATHWIRGRIRTARSADTKSGGGQFAMAWGEGGEIGSCESLVVDPATDNAIDPDSPPEDVDAIRAGLARLGPRQRYVLCHRFGLDGHEKLTLVSIGKKLGLSRERIRQIQASAMDKIRRAVESARHRRCNNGGR